MNQKRYLNIFLKHSTLYFDLVFSTSSDLELPLSYRLFRYFWILNILRNLLRPLQEDGMMVIPNKQLESKKEDQHLDLILWGKEGCADTLKARELLCCLERKYLFKTVPFGAVKKRKEFLKKKNQHPTSKWYLLTDACVLETENDVYVGSHDIAKFLLTNFKTGERAKESYADFSTEGAKEGHLKL